MNAKSFIVIQGGRKRGGKLWRGLFIAGTIILAIFLFWNSLGYIALWAAEVTVATNSEVVASLPIECFVLREERLLYSPASGQYIPLVENGAKVRKGQEVARLENSTGNIRICAPEAGVILHGLDGYENQFSLDSPLREELVEALSRYLAERPPAKSAGQVKAGDKVGLIITNAGYRLVTGLSFHTSDQRQKIEAEDGATYDIIPRSVKQAEDKFWVQWDVKALADELGQRRFFSAQMITLKQEAVLIPAKALCTRKGVQGVLVLFRGKPVFNPVAVVATQKAEVAVKGLAHGQRVLTLPWWASLAKWWWLK